MCFDSDRERRGGRAKDDKKEVIVTSIETSIVPQLFIVVTCTLPYASINRPRLVLAS